MKKIIIITFSFIAIFLFTPHTHAVNELSASTVTENFKVNTEDVDVQTDIKSDGKAIVAYPRATKNKILGIEVIAYKPNKEKWSKPIQFSAPEGTTGITVEVEAVKSGWIVNWRTVIKNNNQETIHYQAKLINHKGKSRKKVLDKQFILNNENTYFGLEVVAVDQENSNKAHIIWRNTQSLVFSMWQLKKGLQFKKQLKKINPNYYTIYPIKKNNKVKSFNVLAQVDKNNQQKIHLVKYNNKYSIKKTTKITKTSWPDLEYITPGTDSALHLLYKKKRKIYHALYQDGVLSDQMQIADDAYGEEVVYNDYGAGQYIVAWATKHRIDRKIKVRVYKSGKGWEDVVLLETANFDYEYEVPYIATFNNGKIVVFWHRSPYEQRQFSNYNPETKTWSEVKVLSDTISNLRIKKWYWDKKSNNGNKYYVFLRNSDKKRYALSLWDYGLNKVTNAPVYLPKKDYTTIEHDSNNGHYILLLHAKKKKLEAVITEEEFFHN